MQAEPGSRSTLAAAELIHAAVEGWAALRLADAVDESRAELHPEPKVLRGKILHAASVLAARYFIVAKDKDGGHPVAPSSTPKSGTPKKLSGASTAAAAAAAATASEEQEERDRDQGGDDNDNDNDNDNDDDDDDDEFSDWDESDDECVVVEEISGGRLNVSGSATGSVGCAAGSGASGVSSGVEELKLELEALVRILG
jgi:hypothetical protein